MTDTTMTTSEVLNRAADLIEARGWHKGSGWVLSTSPANSELCLEGGIQAAMGSVITPNPSGVVEDWHFAELWSCPAYRAVTAHLDLCDGDQVYQWNDRTDRTAAEVIEVLRACAVIEASREREPAEVAS